MSKATLREELREIGDAMATNFHCALEGEADESDQPMKHDDYWECWHCWGRHLIARAQRGDKP